MTLFLHIVGYAIIAPIGLFLWISGFLAWTDKTLSTTETVSFWIILWTVACGLLAGFLAIEGWW